MIQTPRATLTGPLMSVGTFQSERPSRSRSVSAAISPRRSSGSPTGHDGCARSHAMNDPLAWIDGEAAEWAHRGLERRLVPYGPSTPGRVERAGRALRNFGSND